MAIIKINNIFIMAYFTKKFLKRINKNEVNIIFELGSRDLIDAEKLQKLYNAEVYAFECNPDCLKICNENIIKFDNSKLHLVNKAVNNKNEKIKFYPFDLELYDNMGSSSMFEIDFSNRKSCDPDKDRGKVQKEIEVDSIRLDNYCQTNNIEKIDMLCIDLQGAELIALQGLGKYLHNVKYIITEASIVSTYKGGVNFKELDNYLKQYNFKYISRNRYKHLDLENIKKIKGWSEFDCLFIRS